MTTTEFAPPIDAPEAWTSAGLPEGRESLCFDLEPHHLRAFERAMEIASRRGVAVEDVTLADFPLDPIARDVERLRAEIERGRGIVLVRGFPVGRWPEDDVELMYWGLGLHLGIAESQSVLGDRLGHVRDMSAEDPNARAYRNHQELALHTDLCQYIGMLCVSPAASGGESRYVSVPAVHNEILAHAPAHLAPLYEGFHYYRVGEEAEGELPYTPHRVPVFSVCEGYLSARYIRAYISAGANLSGEALTDEAVAALDHLDEVSHRDDIMIETALRPGEATFINNYVVMHARTAFEDDRERGLRRHLLRLWLNPVNGRRPTVPEIELFSSGGIARQPGRQPSGEGELLRSLGGGTFHKASLRHGE